MAYPTSFQQICETRHNVTECKQLKAFVSQLNIPSGAAVIPMYNAKLSS